MKKPGRPDVTWIFRLVLAFGLAVPCAAFADKVELLGGFYSLSATRTQASGSVSGTTSVLASYRLGYRHPVWDNFEVAFGYNFLMSQIVGGDLGYGLDFGAAYYFLGPADSYSFEFDKTQVRVTDIWRPYVGVSFDQRQFQGVSTGFAGPGIQLGIERAWKDRLSFKSQARYIGFSQNGNIKSSYLDLLFGVALSL